MMNELRRFRESGNEMADEDRQKSWEKIRAISAGHEKSRISYRSGSTGEVEENFAILSLLIPDVIHEAGLGSTLNFCLRIAAKSILWNAHYLAAA